MTVTLYTNSSDNKVVSKSITQIESKTCNPFKEVSVIAPVIIVAGEISASVNYMYIDKFARYYYITNIVYNGNQSVIYGRVDSLMSFSANIYESAQFVNRSETTYNLELTDNLIIPNRPVTKVKKFGSVFGNVSTGNDNCYLIGVK